MMAPTQIVHAATLAANFAGAAWMARATPKYSVHDADLAGNIIGPSLGTMLDMCGCAHVQFTDKRSKQYKQFVKAGLVRANGNAVVEIPHDYMRRQEHGLMLACAEAAKQVLEHNGVTGLRIWSWID